MIKKAYNKKIFVILDTPEPVVQNKILTSNEELGAVKPVTTGVVAFVGDDVTKDKVKVGTKLYLGEHLPKEQVIGGQKYIVIKEEDLIAEI